MSTHNNYIRSSSNIIDSRQFAVSVYQLLPSGVQYLQKNLNGNTFLTALSALISGSPFEQIYSLRLYPFNVRTAFGISSTAVDTVYIGEHAVAIAESSVTGGYKLQDAADQHSVLSFSNAYTFTRHFNDFRDLSACEYMVYLPYYGFYTFDPNELLSTSPNQFSFYVTYQLDLIHGVCTITLGKNSTYSEIYDKIEFKLGCDVPINATDRSSQLLSILGTAFSATAAGAFAGIGVAGTAGVSALDAAQNATRQASRLQPKRYNKIGDSTFNQICNSDAIHLIQIWENNPYADAAQLNAFIQENGRPTSKYLTLYQLTSNTSDTYKYAKFNIQPHTLEELSGSCAITANELEELVQILNDGVYFL